MSTHITETPILPLSRISWSVSMLAAAFLLVLFGGATLLGFLTQPDIEAAWAGPFAGPAMQLDQPDGELAHTIWLGVALAITGMIVGLSLWMEGRRSEEA